MGWSDPPPFGSNEYESPNSDGGSESSGLSQVHHSDALTGHGTQTNLLDIADNGVGVNKLSADVQSRLGSGSGADSGGGGTPSPGVSHTLTSGMADATTGEFLANASQSVSSTHHTFDFSIGPLANPGIETAKYRIEIDPEETLRIYNRGLGTGIDVTAFFNLVSTGVYVSDSAYPVGSIGHYQAVIQ